MKIYSKEITINTNKDVKGTRIICFSDLHYSKKLDKKILPFLFDKITSYNPNYICFLGDLLNDDSFEEVYNYINILRYIAPVILIDGNHDIKSFAVNDKAHENKHHILSDELKTLLANIPNVYYLNNNQTLQCEDISFTGTNFYHNSHEEDNIDFLNENIPEINPNSFNILLSHSPYIITKNNFEKLRKEYQNFDATFTGHIHNALMPTYIDNQIKDNLGLYTWDTGYFPTDYLGVTDIILDEEHTLKRINVPPIRTFNPENIIFTAANKLYPPSIRLVKVKKN